MAETYAGLGDVDVAGRTRVFTARVRCESGPHSGTKLRTELHIHGVHQHQRTPLASAKYHGTITRAVDRVAFAILSKQNS